jgi:hypothetical protein
VDFRRIDGDCALSKRQEILNDFESEENGFNVLIMTTGTGAFGLVAFFPQSIEADTWGSMDE